MFCGLHSNFHQAPDFTTLQWIIPSPPLYLFFVLFFFFSSTRGFLEEFKRKIEKWKENITFFCVSFQKRIFFCVCAYCFNFWFLFWSFLIVSIKTKLKYKNKFYDNFFVCIIKLFTSLNNWLKKMLLNVLSPVKLKLIINCGNFCLTYFSFCF